MSEEPNEERLDELEEHIQAARKKAEEVLDPHAHDPHFSDSGDEEDEDDQTIAPPG